MSLFVNLCSRSSRIFSLRLQSITRNTQFSTTSHRTSRKLSTMETIKQTIAQNLGGPSHQLVPEHQQFSLEQVPSLKGKVAVVTGGSEGIGFGCTHTLLSHGIEKLFILSLVKDKADGAVEAIRSELGDEAAKKVDWIECDLSDWGRVKEVADQISNNTDRLDILINNAGRGIMTYQLTDYGVDRHVRPPLALPISSLPTNN